MLCQDTDLTVWDIVSEAGLFRLKGHTNEITKILFFKGHNILVSRWAKVSLFTEKYIDFLNFEEKSELLDQV